MERYQVLLREKEGVMTFGTSPTCQICGQLMYWNGIVWTCFHHNNWTPSNYNYHYHYGPDEETKKEIADLKKRVEELERDS